MRTCVACGQAEDRRKDEQGRYVMTNISPITGQCIDCLVKHGAKPMPAVKAYDWAKRAAGDDE